MHKWSFKVTKLLGCLHNHLVVINVVRQLLKLFPTILSIFITFYVPLTIKDFDVNPNDILANLKFSTSI
jgi:hypothetical protein